MGSNNYDRLSELKAFDDTKAGVKGLVDAGVTKIPQIFIHGDHQKHKLDYKPICCDPNIKIPIIDLEGINKEASLRSEIIDKVRDASEKWGFFQVINHGIPTSILDEAIDGARRFFEQDVEIKKKYYSRDFSQKVHYMSNYTLFRTPAACWSDTLGCVMGRNFSSPEKLPEACRDIITTYNKEVLKLGSSLFEVLSEALGLAPNYLNDMGCPDEISIASNYYPACPEPELTVGARVHSDHTFITLLLQDQIGGLQVFHENQWFDVVPIPGALVVNIGNLIQVMTNDKFKSAYHRVRSKNTGPRISIASFFINKSSTPCGPIKELLSEENPPVYCEVTVQDLVKHEVSKDYNDLLALEKFKAEMEIRNCDRISELKAFDDTKAGVKGLVDVGVTKVPKIFILEDHQKQKLDDMPICCDPHIKIPIIDLEGIKNDASLRSEIIDKVRDASEKWGFFQVINHGISTSILDEAIDGARRFFDQELEIKEEYYSRDYSKRVLYLSNYTLYQAQAASWSDTLSCFMGRNLASAEELPAACRDILITYNKEVLKLGSTLLEVLSESLGLVPNYLNDMGCGDEINISCHYYPACPEPELTMGIRAHADSGFLTILLQNQIGGLQVLHESQWFDVVPTPGAFVVNLGYLMQLISNDQFKSVYHRVLSKNEGPRISIASCFISRSSTPYGPIKELVSEGNPAVYSEITAQDVVKQQFSKVKKGLSTLDNFKLPSHSA